MKCYIALRPMREDSIDTLAKAIAASFESEQMIPVNLSK
jgi:hypothetical protein